MTAYAYRAIDVAGRPVRGRREAADERDLRDRLMAESLTPLSIVEARSLLARRGGYRLSETAAAAFAADLARFLGSGLSLGQTLQIIETTADGRDVARLAGKLRSDLMAGVQLSEALAVAPGQTGRFLAALAKAGETTGRLAEILLGGAAALRASAALKQRLVTLVLYPAFVLAMATAAILLFAFAVLPALEPAFHSLAANLPLSTRVVLAAGRLLRAGAPYFGAGVGAAAVLLALVPPARSAVGRAIEALLQTPLGLGVLQDTAFAGFAQRLSVAIAAGVPHALAFRISAEAVGTGPIRAALLGQEGRLREGAKISDALAAVRATPRLLIGLVRVGETSADLARVLAEAAEILAGRARERTERALSLATPLIVLGVGLVVGGVVLVVFQGLLAISASVDV